MPDGVVDGFFKGLGGVVGVAVLGRLLLLAKGVSARAKAIAETLKPNPTDKPSVQEFLASKPSPMQQAFQPIAAMLPFITANLSPGFEDVWARAGLWAFTGFVGLATGYLIYMQESIERLKERVRLNHKIVEAVAESKGRIDEYLSTIGEKAINAKEIARKLAEYAGEITLLTIVWADARRWRLCYSRENLALAILAVLSWWWAIYFVLAPAFTRTYWWSF